VGSTSLDLAQPDKTVHPRRSAMDASGTRRFRISVVLLLMSLFCLAGLAKHSFSLPRSSANHWISQACKMFECRRVTAPRAVVLRAPILPVKQRLVPSSVRLIAEPDSPQPQNNSAFLPNTLRAPPSLA